MRFCSQGPKKQLVLPALQILEAWPLRRAVLAPVQASNVVKCMRTRLLSAYFIYPSPVKAARACPREKFGILVGASDCSLPRNCSFAANI